MDKTKKIILAIGSSFALVIGWHYTHRSRVRSPDDVFQQTHPSKDTIAKSSVASMKRVENQLSPSNAVKSVAQVTIPPKPQGNVIEFQVVDGMAIAYGDVILGKPLPGENLVRGNTEVATPQLWSSPEIPYVINSDLPNPARVERALEYFKQHTPVSFVPYSGQGDAVVFEIGIQHCLSTLGHVGGLQPIKLAADCQTEEVIHEIMHALGFIHEQSRPDRDQYIQVLWPNIEEDYKSQYNVVPETFTTAIRGSVFDYHSVMLYHTDTFARQPGVPTMQSLTNEVISPVQEGLSEGDMKRLNQIYSGHE